jgi:flagellar biosynthesis/type III secretory pathway chaperone
MDREHKTHTKTFEELDYAEQAKSISAQINILERAIIANARKAKVEQKETPIPNRIEQVERLVQRLKEKYR